MCGKKSAPEESEASLRKSLREGRAGERIEGNPLRKRGFLQAQEGGFC